MEINNKRNNFTKSILENIYRLKLYFFRGPKGVWTLEKKGLKPDINVSWDDAQPTFTHMAISTLDKIGLYLLKIQSFN